jgi:ribosomal protein S18 acetylase RimI-like enzyme
MIAVKKSSPENIYIIQSIAEVTWPVAYGAILPPQQLAYMLNLFYSKEAIELQMQKGHEFVIAYDNAEPAGFASYSSKSIEDGYTWRLHKLYVDPAQQGKGVGQYLLDFVCKDILHQGGTKLELNVNRQNKAIDFYKRNHFTIIKEEDIDIGNGYFMNDYIMLKPLP